MSSQSTAPESEFPPMPAMVVHFALQPITWASLMAQVPLSAWHAYLGALAGLVETAGGPVAEGPGAALWTELGEALRDSATLAEKVSSFMNSAAGRAAVRPAS